MSRETTVQLTSRIVLTLMLALVSTSPAQTSDAPASETLQVDARAQGAPFPHFWEQTFGSGRAILSLRESYRKDLHSVKQVTDFQSVRFHGIFDDEVGLYDPDRKPIQFGEAVDIRSKRTGDEVHIALTVGDEVRAAALLRKL